MSSDTAAALIVRNDADLAVSFTPQALELRDDAIERAGLIAKVNSPVSQEQAVEAQKDLRRVLNLVESARKAVKEPVLEMGRKIDAAAKQFVADLAKEEIRIARLVGDYQAEQLAIARAAERKRQEELARIEAERQEAVRKAQEEATRAAAQAKTEEERKAIEAAAQREAQRQAELAAQQLEALGAPPAPPKAEGQSVRPVYRWEVTDIWKLARMHPGLVRIEPNRQEINDVIASGTRQIDGLRIWEEVKSSVRVGNAKTELIEV